MTNDGRTRPRNGRARARRANGARPNGAAPVRSVALVSQPRRLRALFADLLNVDLDPDDPSNRDPEFIAAVAPLLDRLAQIYFRREGDGLEHVPPRGPFLVVMNHNGGPMLPDLWVMLGYWATTMGPDRPAYAMVHDAAMRVPFLKNLLVKLGGLRANRENATKVIKRKNVLLVYPGGELDSYRSFWRRNQIDFHGRTGFISLAYENGLPIVPVVNIGGHEVYFTIWSSQRLARWTGMERWTKVRTLPVTFGLPWGMWLTGFVPYLPLPSKFVYRVGRPIRMPRNPALAHDQAAIQKIYGRVTGQMQAMLDDLARRRRFPVIG